MPELVNRVLNHWDMPFSELLDQLGHREPAELGGLADGHLTIRVQSSGRDSTQVFLEVLELVLRHLDIGIVNNDADVEVARSRSAQGHKAA